MSRGSPAGAFAEARSLLVQLGAFDRSGRLTPHGRTMSRLVLHPRLSHMVVKGSELGARDPACEIAALLTERDPLRRHEGVPGADIRTRLDLLRGTVERHDVDGEALRRARAEVRACRRASRPDVRPAPGVVGPGVLLGFAYPDRIAQRRPGTPGRFILSNGLGAILDPQSLSGAGYLVVVELDGKVPESASWSRLPPSWSTSGSGEGLQVLPWNDGARRIRERIAFLRVLDPSWPDFSDRALVDLSAALLERLSWEQRAALDRLAPTHVTVPSGSRVAVDYGDPGLPVLAVRLQEMFGLTETPRIGEGRSR